jgi:hypothetical protein
MKAGPSTGGECANKRHFSASQTEWWRMEQQTVRKTFKYKLKPTPQQARILERALRRRRSIYHAAIGERQEAWRNCGVSVSY